MDIKERTSLIENILLEKNAADLDTVDVSDISSEVGIFIICTALNERHARTLSDCATEKAKALSIPINGVEGYDSAKWILIDMYDIVIHIFTESERKLYDLEKLWRDGKFAGRRNAPDEKG